MRAAMLTRARTIEVREVPDPVPGPGEVRLRIRYCGVCGSDRMLFATGALAGPTAILGHEISAVVEHDPSGSLPPGTPVVPYPARSCGRCLWCRDGRPRFCLAPAGPAAAGGFAELACYPSSGLIPIPEGLDQRTAALAEPLGVAIRAVERSGARPGELVYVSGLGSLGLLVVAALVERGCRVVGGDPLEGRRTAARDLGCEVALDPTARDPAEVVREIDPHGARVALECAGAPSSLEQAFDVCAPEGTVGILGVPTGPALLLRMTVRELHAFSVAGPSTATMRRALDMLASGPALARLITDVFPLERAAEALAPSSTAIKVLISPT